ncbi:hypothetical protein Q5530_16445 [Saccharothrix sp. BKS2]|uniref:hypothetical protein n=1 Tax=Saccharothrix sp. BKS2 TaxID=3064400 RepID=UPI0039E767DA
MLKRASAGALVLLLTTSSPAWAGPWGGVNCSQRPSPTCELGVGIGDRPGPVTGRPGNAEPLFGHDSDDPYWGCRRVPVDYQDPAGQPEGPGGWFIVLCSSDGKDPLSHGPVWVAEDSTSTVSPEQLAQTARERLRLPSVQIARNPVGTQLVHLPTWLWLAGGWREVSESASVPGVSVMATARPVSVSWSMGDGSTVSCTGPGTAYMAGTDPTASSPDCGHVYRRSSADRPGEAFPVSATVHWTVTWSGAGQGGTFPGMTTTGTASFRVAESQALNNGVG